MQNNIKQILNDLDNGKINYKKAIKLIKKENTSVKQNKQRKKASKLKIIVIDKTNNQHIKIPTMPFWLLNGLGTLGIGIANLALKFNKDLLDEDCIETLDIIKEINLNKIFKILKKHRPFNLVHVEAGNETEVKISIV